MIIFITGGVRSGKSSFAETTAVYYGGQTLIHYIATSARQDGEMLHRIKRHVDDRERSGYRWKTWEQARNIHELEYNFEPNSVILLDCLTNLLTNELFYGWEEKREQWLQKDYRKAVYKKIIDGIIALSEENTLIVVSNEVNYGMPLRDSGSYYFAQMLGILHQDIVQISDWVYQVEQGLPILRKGPHALEKPSILF